MTRGFGHFDASHHETFAAALLLVCLEEDEAFRSRVCSLVRQRARLLGANAGLLECGREESLDPGPAERRRSDLWLRFDDGIVLVEVKVHSRWDPFGVARQMDAQRRSVLRGEAVHEAVLLAPGALVRRLSPKDLPTLSWLELLRAVDGIDRPARVVRLAQAHWSQYVETDFGLPAATPVQPLDAVAAQTACLVAFLRAVLMQLGGTPRDRDAVWFSSPDGRPRGENGWAWIGIAVPGRLPDFGDGYVGVYTYSETPATEKPGTYLEAYRMGNNDVPIASLLFEPRDFSPEALGAEAAAFVSAFTAARGAVLPVLRIDSSPSVAEL